MVDFKTWWKYREGKEGTIIVCILIALSAFLYYADRTKGVGPEICYNFCSSGKGGILKQPEKAEKMECVQKEKRS